MKGKKGLYIIIALVCVLAAGIWWQGRNGPEVDAIKAQTGSITVTVEDSALVQSAEDYDSYAAQNARVTNIAVEIGQLVEKDQLLMQLENSQLQLQLSENRSLLAQAQSSAHAASAGVNRLELQLEDARMDLSRSEELLKQGALSNSDYEKAVLLTDTLSQSLKEQLSYFNTLNSQVKGLQDSIAKLTELEKDLQVVSPIKGVVLSLPIKKDQPVLPGTLLASIAVVQDLEIRADILSDDLADIEIGQPVSITAPVLGDTSLMGTVLQIYPRAEEKMSALGVVQRRVPVIISIDNHATLKPGYEVRVAIQTQHLKDVIVLPLESVRKTNDGNQVMLIKGNQIKYQEVETGLSDRNNIEIKSGIKTDDLVLRDASLELKENARVQPRQ